MTNSEARKRLAEQTPTDTACSLDAHVLAVTVRELADELARVTSERDEARQAARQLESAPGIAQGVGLGSSATDSLKGPQIANLAARAEAAEEAERAKERIAQVPPHARPVVTATSPAPSVTESSVTYSDALTDPAPSERVELTDVEKSTVRATHHVGSAREQVENVESIIAARLARVEAERDRLSALIRDQLGHCICTPYPMGDGPQEDCGHHGREYGWWVEGFCTVQQRNIDLDSERDCLAEQVAAVEALAEKWRYKGELGWGPWQVGEGPDGEGCVLDSASSELRAALSDPGTALARVRAETWDEGYSTALGDFDIAARAESRSVNPYRAGVEK